MFTFHQFFISTAANLVLRMWCKVCKIIGQLLMLEKLNRYHIKCQNLT